MGLWRRRNGKRKMQSYWLWDQKTELGIDKELCQPQNKKKKMKQRRKVGGSNHVLE